MFYTLCCIHTRPHCARAVEMGVCGVIWSLWIWFGDDCGHNIAGGLRVLYYGPAAKHARADINTKHLLLNIVSKLTASDPHYLHIKVVRPAPHTITNVMRWRCCACVFTSPFGWHFKIGLQQRIRNHQQSYMLCTDTAHDSLT